MSLKWEVAEIAFNNERQCMFLSKNRGHDAPACYMFQQMPRSIKFKAINAAARESVAAESMGRQDWGAAAASRASRQQAFLGQKPSRPSMPPRPEKRASDAKTRLAPEGQQRRME